MKVLLIGYGKMGKFIFNELKKRKEILELFVSDISFENDFDADGVHFIKDYKDEDASSFNCAFIATPAHTHCEVMERLIRNGLKNIYVEKPCVINDEEYNRILEIKGDCRITTGYILRQTDSMPALRRLMSDLYDQDFRLELCSVSYQKYLPATLEKRAMDDIGVFEEIVHVWDLIFNYFGLKKAEVLYKNCYTEDDPEKPGRAIFAKFSYLLGSYDCNVLVNITSSFRAKSKKRDFYFVFKDTEGDRRNVLLSFDNADNFDKITVTDSKRSIIFKNKYPALAKLSKQLDEVFDYFATGNKNNLCLFEDSETINRFIKYAGVKLA